MSTDNDWKHEDHAVGCGWHEAYEPSFDMEWAAAFWAWSQAADEIERLKAELDRFVLTNDECLSADGKTAHRAWYRKEAGGMS